MPVGFSDFGFGWLGFKNISTLTGYTASSLILKTY